MSNQRHAVVALVSRPDVSDWDGHRAWRHIEGHGLLLVWLVLLVLLLILLLVLLLPSVGSLHKLLRNVLFSIFL